MYEMVLDLAALLLSLFCLVYSVTVRRALYAERTKGLRGMLQNQHAMFLCLSVAVMFSAATSIAFTLGRTLGVDDPVMLYLKTLYALFYNLPALLFSLYVLSLAQQRQRRTLFYSLFGLPFLLGELLTLYPILRAERAALIEGPGQWLLFAVTVFYTLSAMLFFVRNVQKLPRADQIAAIILIVITAVGITIQAVWSVPVALFFEVIAVFGFMALLEHDENASATGMSDRFMVSAMVALAMTFLAVIVMNVALILNMTGTQTERIGSTRMEVIRGDLQGTISKAEADILRVALAAEQLIESGASYEAISDHFNALWDDFASDESFMNVYIAGRDWHYIPGFDAPPEFHANERLWYLGAVENPDTVYITEPYIDAKSGTMCFTASKMLTDGSTVVGLDLNFVKPQESILRMTEGTDQTAMIVTSGGLIAGYTDMSLVGERADERLPEYADVLRRVAASQEHDTFRVTLNDRSRMIFSSETSNHWYLILSVDTAALFSDSYRQIAMMASVNLLMLVVVVLFYAAGTRNRRRIVKALGESERFLDQLAHSLRREAQQIHVLNDINGEDTALAMGQVMTSGGNLDRLAENARSFSEYLLARGEQEVRRQTARHTGEAQAPSIRARNRILIILLVAMFIVLFVCGRSTAIQGDIRLNREADGYVYQLNGWITQQQSVLYSITNLISSQPELVADYDSAVHMLSDFAENNPEISACYMANPYAAHPVIMNTGWEPGENYRPETRPWYKAAERSANHFSISAPYMDVQTGTYCITLSRVVYGEQGEFLGVFGIDFFLDKLIGVLGESYTAKSYAFMVDSDGIVLNHPNSAYQMSDASSVSVEDTEYAEAYHRTGVTALKDYSGHVVACLSRKTDSGFTVMVANRWGTVYGSVLLVTLVVLALFVICIASIALVINRLIRWQEQTNRQLVEAAEAAKRAGEAKSHFLSQMSHEIRTPMNAIIGLDTIALRDPGISAQTRAQLNKIGASARHLLALINDILDMSRIESGRMTINEKEFDFKDLIDQIDVMVGGQCAEKGLQYNRAILGRMDARFIGDDLKLKQVLINILGNAVKFTDAPGTVTFTAEQLDREDGGCTLRFTMKDTGVGMDKAFIPKLFDAFSQEDTANTNRYGGSGLGMAITRNIVEMMGGKIDVDSEKGVGSTFTVTVPLKRGSGAAIPAPAAAEPPEAVEPQTGWHVLIAEDNALNAEILMDLLEMEGVTAEWVENGQIAVERFGASEPNCFDVVLMDMRMPVMDGLEATRALRKLDRPDAKRVPIIALTANAFEDDVRQCLDAGMDAHLSKPIDMTKLFETVNRLLSQRRG